MAHVHSLYALVEEAITDGKLTYKVGANLLSFYTHYTDALKDSPDLDHLKEQFIPYLNYIIEELNHPYPFPSFHEKLRSPIDFYQFGQEMIRPLVDLKQSEVKGIDTLKKISEIVENGENACLFSNHQTEADPQIISILLEKQFPHLAENMIFVAGDRVITDPMTIPFSKGRNLICIYSKKRIDVPPEKKAEKLLHNQRTMRKMAELLSEGGKCIYVAPSGGRDRPDAQGKVLPDPFDAASIEMFYLMACHSQIKSHFYPLALWTHAILPPPSSLTKELGEERKAFRSSAAISIGEKIDMDKEDRAEEIDKKLRRQVKADRIWNLVLREYQKIAP